MTDIAETKTDIAETKISKLYEDQDSLINETQDLIRKRGKDNVLNEQEMDELNSKIDADFFSRLEEGLHPDSALALKQSIEKINNFRDSEYLEKIYNYVDSLCKAFEYKEHNISTSLDISEISNNLNGIDQEINGDKKINLIGLEQLNKIAQDSELAKIITATKGILQTKKISGDFLVNMAEFLGVKPKEDKKYSRERRLKNLGREIFGTGNNSLYQYFKNIRPKILKEYQENFISTTFDNDVILEKELSMYTPMMSGYNNDTIELKDLTIENNIVEDDDFGNPRVYAPEKINYKFGIFNEAGNILKGVIRKGQDIKSGTFDKNGHLMVGYHIANKGRTIHVGRFNYDGSLHTKIVEKFDDKGNALYYDDQGNLTTTNTGKRVYERIEDKQSVEAGIPWSCISYDMNINRLGLTDDGTRNNGIQIQSYTYDKANQTISLLSNELTEPKIIHKNGDQERESVVFDFLTRHDPLGCLNDQGIIDDTPTMFQQFCENNGINYNNSMAQINAGIESINEKNYKILKDINIVDLIKIEKIENEPGCFMFEGNKYKIDSNNQFQLWGFEGDNKTRMENNNIAIESIINIRYLFSKYSEEQIGQSNQNNRKICDLKFENTRAFEKFFEEHSNLAEIYITQIQEYIGNSNAHNDAGLNLLNVHIDPINDPSLGNTEGDPTNLTNQEINLKEMDDLTEDSIKKIFTGWENQLTKYKVVEFFNNVRKQDINEKQKKLLELTYIGLTNEWVEKDLTNPAYKSICELQDNLDFKGNNVDGKFGPNTFKALKKQFDSLTADIDITNKRTPTSKKIDIADQEVTTIDEIINIFKEGLGNKKINFNFNGEDYFFAGNKCKNGSETFSKITQYSLDIKYESKSGKIIIDTNKKIFAIIKGGKLQGYTSNGDKFECTASEYDTPAYGIKTYNTNSKIPNHNSSYGTSKSYNGYFDARGETVGTRELKDCFFWELPSNIRGPYDNRIEYNGGYNSDFYLYYKNKNKDDIVYTETYTQINGNPIPGTQSITKYISVPIVLTRKSSGDNLILTGRFRDQYNITRTLQIQISKDGTCKKTIDNTQIKNIPDKKRGQLVYNQFYTS